MHDLLINNVLSKGNEKDRMWQKPYFLRVTLEQFYSKCRLWKDSLYLMWNNTLVLSAKILLWKKVSVELNCCKWLILPCADSSSQLATSSFSGCWSVDRTLSSTALGVMACVLDLLRQHHVWASRVEVWPSPSALVDVTGDGATTCFCGWLEGSGYCLKVFCFIRLLLSCG